MNVENTDTDKNIALRDLYAEMRELLLNNDLDSEMLASQIMMYKSDADALENTIHTRVSPVPYSRQTNDSAMTIDELSTDNTGKSDLYRLGMTMQHLSCINPDLSQDDIHLMALDEIDDENDAANNPSPDIEYCNQMYPSLSWKKFTAIRLKIVYDEMYKDAVLAHDNEHANQYKTDRRELDAQLKRMLIDTCLYTDMYYCAGCHKQLSDEELDEKALAMDYADGYTVNIMYRQCGGCRTQE